MTSLLLAISLLVPSQPPAQQPPRFKWSANDIHTYTVKQSTIVRETTLDVKTEKPVVSEARTNLTLTKKWHVRSVDGKGVATIEMTITAMKNEFRKSDGDSVVRDSARPEDAKAMAGFLNVPIVVVRVDSQGRLVEVKESKGGSAARLQAELPFRMILPETAPSEGQSWERTFTLKLDPPLGTGESYEFSQKFTPTANKDGLFVARVETELKDPPKALAERVPLVPMLWTGEVYFNTVASKYHAARLKVKAELPNYQGQGTRFEYESFYSEDAVKE